MQYRRLGSSGVKVSTISLGSWLTYGNAVEQDVTDACVRGAFEGGVNFFDTADIYNKGEAELALGLALKPYRRRDYVLASKAFFPMSDQVNDGGLSRKHLHESCAASLERLQVEYLDLYQCHRYDEEVAVEEVVRAMGDLIRHGKILYWGVSFWSAAQITSACETADRLGAPRPITNQPPYSLLERSIEAEVVPTAQAYGVGQIVFSPLAQGLLTGKYRGGAVPENSRAADDAAGQFLRPRMTEHNLALVDRIAGLADQAGLKPAVLALAWVLGKTGVSSAIVGARTPAQLEENLTAADTELALEISAQLDDWTATA